MKKRKLNSREESILLLLKKFDFMTRDQLSRYFKLGTKRNTNRVITALTDYLSHVRNGHHFIYYLNATGRAYVDCKKVRKKSGHVEHTIMRNEFWLFYGCPSDWRNEVKVSDSKATIICDSLFMKNFRYHFLEVDHTQPMSENRTKIARYIELYRNGLLAEKLKHFPTVIWLTTSELRRNQLIEACKELPSVKVYTINEIK
ncbi:replication-relaxation family protein [Psychrobacillus sp. Sa2BUA9]|uniref:Replication-relaxation family protein n=2 Tax=Psychrobacillus faecigallinarum TaxID=2762235 RepID=A0ABR8RBW2_9BACI|nr:replication-relaxation family protein [Psychrobacillus faecigallinarum]